MLAWLRKIGILGAILAFLGSIAPAQAQQKFENLDRLDGLVATTVGATIGQPGGAMAPVDRRLRLAACPQLPDVTGPVFGAAMISCKELGWRIRVPLSPGGNVVATPQIQRVVARPAPVQSREVVVRRGDPVQMIAGGSTFSVSRMMMADEDGAVGQMIRVREDRKADPVFAQVVETGIVRAPGFKEF